MKFNKTYICDRFSEENIRWFISKNPFSSMI